MNVFLTGGTRGIGKEIKDIFKKNNHFVYAPTRQELDLSNLDSVNNFIKNFDNNIDVVINNAGIIQTQQVTNFNLETFYNTMNTNFISHLILTTFFINRSITKNDKLNIVNVGSIRMQKLKKGRFLYTLSKNCLDTLTKYIAYECSNSNIVCNTISPGYVNTQLLYQNNSVDSINNMLNEIPLKRFVEPKEIANFIYYLTTENTYINGQNINIDGGITCS